MFELTECPINNGRPLNLNMISIVKGIVVFNLKEAGEGGAFDTTLSIFSPRALLFDTFTGKIVWLLTLFKLTSGLPKTVWGASPRDPPPVFPYCDTNLKYLVRFWKALGLYFNDLQKIWKFAKFHIFIANIKL